MEERRAVLVDGDELPCDLLVWVAGATSHGLLRESGLPTDARGFVLIRSTLQVEGYDDLFAVGDCATLSAFPKTPKAGVYAVRQGPFLTDNLLAAAAGKPLRDYRPQSDFLTLLNLGDGARPGRQVGTLVRRSMGHEPQGPHRSTLHGALPGAGPRWRGERGLSGHGEARAR